MLPHLVLRSGERSVVLHSYSLALALFLLFALAVSAWRDRRDRRGRSGSPRVEAFLIAIPLAVLFGRMMEVALNWAVYRNAPWRALVAPDTPVAIYGAFAGGILAAALRMRPAVGSLGGMFDESAPLILAGEAVTRLGCFLQGCCFGTSTRLPWGISFPPGSPAYVAQVESGLLAPGAPASIAVHPTQLYSAAAAFLILVVVAFARRRRRWATGAVFLVVAGFYAASRFTIEFVRADPGRGAVFGLSGPQLISVAVVLATLATMFRLAGTVDTARSF